MALMITPQPCVRHASPVVYCQRHDKVRTLPPQRAHTPPAAGIRLGPQGQGFQGPHPWVADARVEPPLLPRHAHGSRGIFSPPSGLNDRVTSETRVQA